MHLATPGTFSFTELYILLFLNNRIDFSDPSNKQMKTDTIKYILSVSGVENRKAYQVYTGLGCMYSRAKCVL